MFKKDAYALIDALVCRWATLTGLSGLQKKKKKGKKEEEEEEEVRKIKLGENVLRGPEGEMDMIKIHCTHV